MTNISWNEIQNRASEFVSKWDGETYEKGESQSFWSDFLSVFGVDRKRHGAFFEYAVKKINNKQGFIDMFWPGKLLAEQKSAGRDLSAANIQAFDYLHNMPDSDLPQYIIVSDFSKFQLINLETREQVNFTLASFPKMVKSFGFLLNVESQNLQEEDPVNRKAAEALARLHNQLDENNFKGHELELLLVRLVFCLFADDAGIFERGIFDSYLRNRTNIDGSDVGSKLGKVFEVLNTPKHNRQVNLDIDLSALPYVNGGLFAEITRMPDFTGQMRAELISATKLDWSLVSPAIFGSMFQGVMDEETRRNLGAHYTSEKNILKLIKPLFLDELYDEFEKSQGSKKKLNEFHNKLGNLKFLDPACGCGNFLVITYREIRKLEHKVLTAIHGRQSLLTDVTDSIKVNVDQMYGIEIEEFPALIAETALWLTDHQMNLAASQQFGHHYARLPLTKRAGITNTNALVVDWEEIIDPKELNYILGNPPFTGAAYKSKEQALDVERVFAGLKGAGKLDYVACWYKKATLMMEKNPKIKSALVSTNSIAQGEQVSILWNYLLEQGIEITFAHQTFRWTNEARGNAAVFCVIIGFSFQPSKNKYLYEYEDIRGEANEFKVTNINPYLINAPNLVVGKRSKPISDVPKLIRGNIPYDDGHLLFDKNQIKAFLQKEPGAQKFVHRYGGSYESLHNEWRYCLWLKDSNPSELRGLVSVMDAIQKVKKFRTESETTSVHSKKDSPSLFGDIRQPKENYLLFPRVSSERRIYLPISYVDKDTIMADSSYGLPGAGLYEFGILTSSMHMIWMRYVCGRLKSDYRYSNNIVYNNFVWPVKVSQHQRSMIEELVQKVLDCRNQFSESTLADLYDPLTMPKDLLDAHKRLDRAVDSLYREIGFVNDLERIKYLFRLYDKAIAKT